MRKSREREKLVLGKESSRPKEKRVTQKWEKINFKYFLKLA